MQANARRFLHPPPSPGGGLILRALRQSHSHLCHPILAAGPLSLRAFYRRLLQLHRMDQRWYGTTGTPECRKGEYMMEGALRGNSRVLSVVAWNAIRREEVSWEEKILCGGCWWSAVRRQCIWNDKRSDHAEREQNNLRPHPELQSVLKYPQKYNLRSHTGT